MDNTIERPYGVGRINRFADVRRVIKYVV